MGPGRRECPFCPMIMKTSGDMKRHILTHTGEKSFAFQQCDYRANRKFHLKSHVKIHKSSVA